MRADHLTKLDRCALVDEFVIILEVQLIANRFNTIHIDETELA
ncbi:Uncharacterised protein [Vibrio cholerae]|nr:Uncharacterised protein [Vibrio cholerae]